MYRLPITLAVLALVLALPAFASGQGNAGIDQYTENPGTSPSPSPPDTGPTPSSTGTATDTSGSGVVGGAGTATSSEAAANDAAAAAGGSTTAGGNQLPATGAETAVLALVGAFLLLGGLWLRRGARQAA